MFQNAPCQSQKATIYKLEQRGDTKEHCVAERKLEGEQHSWPTMSLPNGTIQILTRLINKCRNLNRRKK